MGAGARNGDRTHDLPTGVERSSNLTNLPRSPNKNFSDDDHDHDDWSEDGNDDDDGEDGDNRGCDGRGNDDKNKYNKIDDGDYDGDLDWISIDSVQ